MSTCQRSNSGEVVQLGGVIIEIVGEAAVMHHGGFGRGDGNPVYDPIPVPWSTHKGAMVFDLRGWACRPMEVIEGDRRHMLLNPDNRCWVRDGTLTVNVRVP